MTANILHTELLIILTPWRQFSYGPSQKPDDLRTNIKKQETCLFLFNRSEMSLLADCFTKLMTERILPNATCVKGMTRIQL